MMKHFILTLLAIFLYSISIAQSDNELAVLKTCLTRYEYNSKKGEFFTPSGESLNINKIELASVNSILTAMIWTSIGDASQSSAKHDITLNVLKEKNGKYELLSQTNVAESINMLNEFSISVYAISASGAEALSVKYGRDTDGDGDEIKFKLFAISSANSELILDHTLIDDSGDGCDVSRMESEVSITEETTNDYFDIQVEENTSTSNFCNENEEEQCTKKRTYKFIWNGSEYSPSR